MFRMSQKLLILIFLFLSINIYSGELKFIASINSDSAGNHLKLPVSIFIDKGSGKIYITDSGNSRFLSYSRDLKPLKEFNAGGLVKTPDGMIKDKKGNIWYIERDSNSIVKINLKLKKIEKKSLKIFPDRLSYFNGIIAAVDRLSGNIFLIDENFKIVKKLGPSNRDFKGFFDLKVKNNEICGMENLTGNIFCFNMQTGLTKKYTPLKYMVQPVSFDFDENENFYILDRYLKKVFIFDKNGRFLSTALKEGEREGELYYPWQIVINDKRIYIVDEGNGRIDVFKY